MRKALRETRRFELEDFLRSRMSKVEKHYLGRPMTPQVLATISADLTQDMIAKLPWSRGVLRIVARIEEKHRGMVVTEFEALTDEGRNLFEEST